LETGESYVYYLGCRIIGDVGIASKSGGDGKGNLLEVEVIDQISVLVIGVELDESLGGSLTILYLCEALKDQLTFLERKDIDG
jgi:hypothetical protein